MNTKRQFTNSSPPRFPLPNASKTRLFHRKRHIFCCSPRTHSHGFKTMPCCPSRRENEGKCASAASSLLSASPSSSRPAAGSPVYHVEACLSVWWDVLTCIGRFGKMLLYGLQGQLEGDHGEVRMCSLLYHSCLERNQGAITSLFLGFCQQRAESHHV